MGGFALAGLWAYGIFLHGLILLTATAVLWRRQRPRLAIAAAAALLGLAAVGVDAFLIEPHWLDVSHRRIESPKIHRPVRIVVVADLQIERLGEYERSAHAAGLGRKTGYPAFRRRLHSGAREPTGRAAKGATRLPRGNSILSGCRPRSPCAGNVDGYRWAESFAGSGVVTVEHRQSFALGEVQLTCLGLAETYWGGNWPPVVNPRPERFHVVVGHVPDFALPRSTPICWWPAIRTAARSACRGWERS